jgi:hypothetical protein
MIIEAQTRIPRSETIGTNGVLKGQTKVRFDRRENLIFESDDKNTSWDGIVYKKSNARRCVCVSYQYVKQNK